MRKVAAFAVALAIALAVLAIEQGHPHDPPAKLPGHAIAVDVGSGSAGATIPAGFIGLSTEYSSLSAYTGRDPDAINPLFARLIRSLAPGGTPLIRFGGDTTDWTWWPLHGVSKPPWARYVLTPLWIELARSLAQAARARLILGINFEADSGALAGAEARALLGGLGSRLIAAFELGNEPEVYGEIGWYRSASGAPVLGRPPSYGFRSYLSDYRAISSAIPGGVPLAGPALALTWPLTIAPRFLSANPRVRMFTFHFYPLKRCFNSPGSPTFPTLGHLLAPRSALPAAGTDAAVSVAHLRAVTIREDEINSVSCKGLPGLSDTFASALWVLDALFHVAATGVDGVNIHTLPNVSYQPFTFSRPGGVWTVFVKPIYYGLLLFTRAAPQGSRLLPTYAAAGSPLRTWATQGPLGTVRVLLINDSRSHPVTATVKPRHPAASATLERLTAPALTAPSGITLAGQTYGTASTTAILSGRRQIATLSPIRGRYIVTLAPASAVLLTLGPR